MNFDTISNKIYIVAVNEAELRKHEFVTPEHFLHAALMFDMGKEIIEISGGNVEKIIDDLRKYFKKNFKAKEFSKPSESFSLIEMFKIANKTSYGLETDTISLGILISSIFSLKESYAKYTLIANGVIERDIFEYIHKELYKEIEQTNNLLNDSDKVDNVEPIIESDVKQKQKEEKEKNQEFINQFTYNMTKRALEEGYDPVIGRENTMERTIQVLLRRLKNNPIHIGFPGVGKTSIIEGLAQKIAKGDVPISLKNANIFYLDIGSLVAGTKYRGDFEKRMIELLQLIEKEENPIIYIDEIHQTIGVGSSSGNTMDATSIIKPYLTSGKIKFIGSTTYDEYKKIFEKDRALSRRFQNIDVEEPSIEESIEILKGLKHKYENFHNVVYDDFALEAACKLTSKYINDRYLPDKAIDAIDETGAFVRMNDETDETIHISLEDVERTISLMAKVPSESISHDELENIKTLDKRLKEVVFGQDDAIDEIVNAVKLSKSGLKEEEKPVASLLFVGPTGVGKTEIAKQLAIKLGVNFVRFDMSEYQEEHSIAKLIGAPAGYAGYDEGGLLTDEIVRSPHSVLLLDEIEKAHISIQNILLQVMDYGTLTDNTGKKANFRNVIIIMTSNAGAREIGRNIIGFDEKKKDYGEIDKAVDKMFSPEFRNRLDEIIVFNPIDKKMAKRITMKALETINELLIDKNIEIVSSDSLISFIAEKGLSEEYGAREILRVIDKDVKKLLAEQILYSDNKEGRKITVDYKDKKVVIIEDIITEI